MTAPFKGSTSGLSRQRLRSKSYQRVTQDVYVLRDANLDLRTRCEAVNVLFPEAPFCLTTSGLLLNLPVDDDGLLHIDRGADAPRTGRKGIKVHRFAIPDKRLHDLDGLRVADGPRCFADLAASMTLEQLVALGDVVSRRWTSEEVLDAVQDHKRRPGAALLSVAVPLLDAGSDSPAETRARLRLHAAGFTALKHKVVVRDIGGGWLAAPDLADEEAKVALQHEGAVHFEKGSRQRMKDLDRDEVTR